MADIASGDKKLNDKTTSPPLNTPSKMAATTQGEIKNYKWTVLDKNFDVVFLVDPNKRNRKNGCLSVSVNGEKCLFKFIPDVPNNDGWTEFVYEEKTYILTRQPLPGKDYEINWCIHIPKR